MRRNELDLRNADHTVISINFVNFMMILNYGLTSVIFNQHFTNLLDNQHISALAAHLISISWNFSVVLLIASWSDVLNEKFVENIFIVFLVCACILSWVFYLDYRTYPIADNYIATGSHEILGIIYLFTYSFSMLFTKTFTVIICWKLYKLYQNTRFKTGLALIMVGGFIMIIFGFSKIYDNYLPENQIKNWEFVRLILLVLGTSIFSFGLNFLRLMYLVDYCRKLIFLIKILVYHLRLESILISEEDKLLDSLTENFSFLQWLSRTDLEKRIYVETIKICDSLILSSGGVFSLALENKSNKVFSRFHQLYPSIYSLTIEATGIPNEVIFNMLLYRKLKKIKI